MHKKFLQAPLKIIGKALMIYSLIQPMYGMDADDDPYFRPDGDSNASRFHPGLKKMAKQALNEAETAWHSDSLGVKWDTGQVGKIYCAYCRTFTLDDRDGYGAPFNYKYYKQFIYPALTRLVNNPYAESKYYRWVWIPTSNKSEEQKNGGHAPSWVTDSVNSNNSLWAAKSEAFGMGAPSWVKK